MRSSFRRRPSPAMVVAVVALVVGFSGSALAGEVVRIAKNSLPGNRLKARSVSGSRIKRNTLTGAEIAETRLGKVPLAGRADIVTKADSATMAGTALKADSVDGISFLPLSYTGAAGGLPEVILDRDGLRLTANCAAGQLSLTATSPGSNDNAIAVTGTETTAPATAGGGDDPDFDTGDSFDIVPALGAGDGDEVLGRLVFNSSYGWTLSADLWLDETATGCRILGVATGA